MPRIDPLRQPVLGQRRRHDQARPQDIDAHAEAIPHQYILPVGRVTLVVLGMLLSCTVGILLATMAPAFKALIYVFHKMVDSASSVDAGTVNVAMYYGILLVMYGAMSVLPLPWSLAQHRELLRTMINVFWGHVTYVGFLALIYVRDAYTFGLLCLMRVMVDMSMDAHVIKNGIAGVPMVGFWMAVASFFGDALLYFVDVGLTRHGTLLFIAGSLLFIHDMCCCHRAIRGDMDRYNMVITGLRNITTLLIASVFALGDASSLVP